jgi:hypothetical protein
MLFLLLNIILIFNLEVFFVIFDGMVDILLSRYNMSDTSLVYLEEDSLVIGDILTIIEEDELPVIEEISSLEGFIV